MPPSQPLDEPAVRVVDPYSPFPATDFHANLVAREMELGQKDFGWRVFHGADIALQFHGEGRVPQVEAVGEHVADGGDGAGSDVCFRGAVRGVAADLGWGVGALGGQGWGGECGAKVPWRHG